MTIDNRHAQIIRYAKELRKNMTEHERKLWFTFLKDHPLRFSRQKVMDTYILDFYCHRAKLAIEIDGSQHYEERQENYDFERTAYLKKLGILVVRYTNRDISLHFNEVKADIDRILRERMGFNPWEKR
ncbi:endonuclease domain-containing protein [uncultured Dialister sp.]|jgi:very-short-patch-repair endonuclease|uniref:endonuclease domain-containing protein n=2 Tax=uncultured Dialister sp. TaxID=278064 RepID=UPI0025DCCA73|nr:endonuclease domain-containing protein [uncultured Dialister sp.]